MSSKIIVKEGELRKRGGRLLRWSHRYFVLCGPKLFYKLRADSTQIRDEFDLSPGCIVTDISEETVGTIKGKKIYLFWIVWPHDKHQKNSENQHQQQSLTIPEESDDEEDSNEQKDGKYDSQKSKHLKGIIQNELNQQKVKQQKVEEQIERHQIHDKNVHTGAKVAAVAAGGVVVGVFTAGIGLIPYLTAIGIAAAVGGGVAALQIRSQYKRPFDSRLVLACDSMADAISWKVAIQHQISLLEFKPALPLTANPNIVSNIIGLSNGNSGSRVIKVIEGMRILESIEPMEGTTCLRAQLVVHCSPFDAFLATMDGKSWPQRGSLSVLRNIDDHADLIRADLLTDCRRGGGHHWVSRSVCLSRFWKLDETGMYLIVLNSAPDEDMMHKDSESSRRIDQTAIVTSQDNRKVIAKKYIPFGCDIVLTIAPRKDAHDDDDQDETAESLIQCTVQVSKSAECQWGKGEHHAFMLDFLTQSLLDLSHSIAERRFSIHTGKNTSTSFASSHDYSKDGLMSPHATSGLSSLNTTRNNKVTHVASIGSGDGSDSPRVLTASRFVSVTQELGNPVNPVKSYEHKVSGKGSSSLSPLRRELSSPQSGSTAPTTTDKSTVPAPAKRRFLFGRTFQTATPPTHSQDDSYLYAGAKDPSTPPSHLSKSVSSVPSEINSHSKQPTTRASKSLRRQRSRAVKNEIDTKEYQLKRLSDQQENARYMDEDFITELKFEIDKLKIEFLDLTGTAYDEVKSASRSLYRRGRRYFSSGTRAGSKRAIDEAMAQRLQDRLIDTRYDKDTDVYDESMFERVSTPGHIPSHWGLPTRSLRCDLYMDSVVAAQNGGGGNSVGVEDSLTEKTNLSSAFIVFGIFLFSTFVLSQYLFSTL